MTTESKRSRKPAIRSIRALVVRQARLFGLRPMARLVPDPANEILFR